MIAEKLDGSSSQSEHISQTFLYHTSISYNFYHQSVVNKATTHKEAMTIPIVRNVFLFVAVQNRERMKDHFVIGLQSVTWDDRKFNYFCGLASTIIITNHKHMRFHTS
jgi:hypothetical protein